MKANQILWMALSAALLMAIPFIASSQSQIPAAINYQGRLTDTLGNPAASGYYEIEFRIWDDAVQNGAGNLVWGRTFALHVVTNGLFNILLTDDGGQITDPTTPTNTLLSAFGGEDRYLGLTITTSNGVSVASPVEISPRQQLASEPYSIQAQTANTVGPLGVTSTALANGSVVAGKIAANAVISGTIASSAVTADKLEDKAVTSNKIAKGAVTSPKLNINGDVHWNDYPLLLGTGGNAGLRHNTTSDPFASNKVDGPILWGYAGGLLGTIYPSNTVALEWKNDQSVTMNGAVTARSGNVSMFGPLESMNYNKTYTAPTDGFVQFTGDHGHWQFVVTSGGTTYTNLLVGDNSGANYETATFAVAKGEKWKWEDAYTDPGHNGNKVILWRPIGSD